METKRPEPLMDHEYDGIQELDYPPPRWFSALFLGTIVYAAGYFLYYHNYDGATLQQEYEREQKEHAALVKRANPPRVYTPKELAAAEKSEDVRSAGKPVFEARCASCHMSDGGGQVGPNLTDDFWITGDGHMASMVPLIQDGVVDKGMPAWVEKLKAEEILAVTSYVRSLRGTAPANPKAPQGVEVPEAPSH